MKYSQLSKEQQESVKAEVLAEGSHLNIDFYDEHTKEFFTNILNLLGFYDITIHNCVGYSQGDGACFTAVYSYKKGALKQVEKFLKDCGDIKETLASSLKDFIESIKKTFYTAVFNLEQHSRYYHSNSVCVENLYINEYESYNEEIEKAIQDSCRGLCGVLENLLMADLDYQHSDENLNDYLNNQDYSIESVSIVTY